MKRRLVSLLVIGIMTALVIVGCGAKKETAEPTETIQTEDMEDTEPTEEPETETEIATETEPETEIETEAESEEQFTYTDMSKTMYAKQTVNVRDLPSTDGNKLGGLSKAQEVKVTGQCNETSWYRVEYNGGVGYVSGSYLVGEKPVVEQSNGGGSSSNTNNGNSGDSSGGNWTIADVIANCPYPLAQAIYCEDNHVVFYYVYCSRVLGANDGDGYGFLDGLASAEAMIKEMGYNNLDGIDDETWGLYYDNYRYVIRKHDVYGY